MFKDTSSFPTWWGVLDVALAFAVAAFAFIIFGMAGRDVDKRVESEAYHAYRFLIHGIFVLLLVFFWFGDRVAWINGLPGLAWRAWIMLYALPAWFAVLRGVPTRNGEHSG